MTRTRSLVPALVAAAVVAVVALMLVTPHEVPAGTVIYGLLYGSLNGLLAAGLVLIYRVTRAINFAYGSMGAVAASTGASLYLQEHWPWGLCIVAALVVGAVVGLGVGALVQWRFSRAPRLVLTVATVGLSQLLSGIAVYIPQWMHRQIPVIPGFRTELSGLHHEINPVFFTGNDLLVAVVVPAIVAAATWILLRTDAGRAVRAVADNSDRARLLGVPIRRLVLGVWILSGMMAGLAVLLEAPSQGVPLDLTAGPALLLAPLAAAVLARMESMPTAFAAGVGLGVLESLIRLNVSKQAVETVVFLVVVVVALLFQRGARDRTEAADESSWSATGTLHALPDRLRNLVEVRVARYALLIGLAVVALVVPAVLQPGRLDQVSVALVFGMVALSLVVLSGWGGVVSLGQIGVVGIGAIVAGDLIMHLNADLFLSLAAAGAAGAVVTVALGLPAVRVKGLYLAVTTLAFAVATDEFFFNPSNFSNFMPSSVLRPVLWKRFSLQSEHDLYLLCLVLLVLAVLAVQGLRRARTGRVIRATRDNLRAAEAAAVPTIGVRLAAFAISGVLAGVAGGLYVVILGSAGLGTFPASDSLVVFSMTVIGGLGSVVGALAGVGLVQWLGIAFPKIEVLLTGVGVLLVLAVFPSGLAGMFERVRDIVVMALARRRGIDTSVWASGDGDQSPVDLAPLAEVAGDDLSAGRPELLRCRAVDASYGSLQVLFGVDLTVYEGEILALLGTNGAGKSSLLRAVTGLLPSQGGTVDFAGHSIGADPTEDIVERGLTMMPGGRGVFPSLSVAENLQVAAWRIRGDRGARSEAETRVATLFPVLSERAAIPAGNLSGGEQQMLSLAMALLVRPRLLCIDELSLGLAPTVVTTLIDAVRQIQRQGTTVVIVEQSVNVALLLAERAVFLEKGQVRFNGPADELLDRPDLLRAVFIGGDITGPQSNGRVRPSSALTDPTLVADPVLVDPVLECRGLIKRFGGITAVNEVDLSIRPGEVVGLIGHNGAGKTTLFDVLSGFLPAESGTITLAGVDVTRLPAHERSIGGLGRTFQEARLFPTLTVSEAIAVALERHLDCRSSVAAAFRAPAMLDSEAHARDTADQIIELVGLDAYRDRPISELSTGTRRIVELACMLAHRPSVLLLDEPTSGVAQAETESLSPLLRRVAEETGSALVVIEHDMAMIAGLSDRLVALELGRVIADGPPTEVLSHPQVIASYLGTDPESVQRSGRSAKVADASRTIAHARPSADLDTASLVTAVSTLAVPVMNADNGIEPEDSEPGGSESMEIEPGSSEPGGVEPEGGFMDKLRAGLGSVGWLPLLILAGLGAVQGFDGTAFGVLAPEIRHTFHLDNAGIDSVTALTGAVPLLCSVFYGNLGDRGDRVRISRNSAILWGVTAVLTGVAPVLALLVVARLAGGIGMLASQTIYPSLLSDYYPQEGQAQVFTLYLLASTVMGLLASPLDGWVGSEVGWRPAFVVLALPTFVFVAMLRYLSEPGRRHAVATTDVTLTVRQSFRHIRSIRTLRRTWLGAFFIGAGVAAIATLVSTFFKDVYHLGPTERGFILSAVGVGGLVGLAASGVAAQRLIAGGRRHLLPAVTGGAGAVLAVFATLTGLAPGLWLSIGAVTMAGLGVGGFLPPYTTTVALVTPSRVRSQAYAWSAVFFAFGAILVAGLVGVIADSLGQRSAFVALGVLVLIGSTAVASAARVARADMLANEVSEDGVDTTPPTLVG